MAGNDSLFVDEGLLPNKTYSYTLTVQSFTATAQATTMDTTSHNWQWQMATLGDGNGSSLNDVTIINDTLAFAVGEIYFQNDPVPYCIAIWNGKEWVLKRLYYYNPNYQATLPLYSVQGIFVFSATDVWLAAGSIFHWNGKDSLTEFSFNRLTLPDPNATVTKLWGSSKSDLYGVGGAGTIVHFNANSTWQKIESGTVLPINDIWGAYNEKAKANEILCIASRTDQNEGKKLLMIKQQSAIVLPDSGLSWMLTSAWFVPNRKYYIAGDGFYELNKIGPIWYRNTALPPYQKSSVRGDRFNNVIVVGAFGLTLFYNGARWQSFHEKTYLSAGSYVKVSIKNNLIVAVGYSGNKGVVAIGKR
jgi:hypothetical protein